MKKSSKLIAAGGIVALFLVLLLAGVFSSDTIEPGREALARAGAEPASVGQARRAQVTQIYEAVGTVRPRTETRIEAQVTGKIMAVKVRAGDVVKRGEVLIVLDSREYAARAERAEQGLQSAQASREEALQAVKEAQAGFAQAEAQYQRIMKLYDEKAVSTQEKDQAEAAYLQAEARLKRARGAQIGAAAGARQAAKAVEEARIATGYTEIRAPEDMEVAKRMAEPGDLAIPGKALLIVQTAGAMRLEAFVREGLVNHVRPGTELRVEIPSLGGPMDSVVEEVLPAADPTTRTFLVKVGLPEMVGAYPGMFGRLLVPAGVRPAVLVPARAVRRVGQLESVRIKEGDQWRWVYVKTGPRQGGEVEILSGLEGTETVALDGELQ